jgi:hypothetical protein
MRPITIENTGKTTTAWLFDGDHGVKVGRATCREGDDFKLAVGAVIALCKVLGEDVADTCYAVLETMAEKKGKRKGKAGVAVKVATREAKGKQIGLVKTGVVKLQLTGMLKGLGGHVRNMGVVGTPTPFKDCNGKPLFVGDLVTVDKLTGTVREGRTWEPVPGLHFMVCEDSDNERSKGMYIMGLLDGCSDKKGKIDGRFKVRLAKSWKAVELGEEHDFVTPVWEGVKA